MILLEDKSCLKKQRHTAKRIYERLRDEHGFTGGLTIVSDYVREKKRRNLEVFVPLGTNRRNPRSGPNDLSDTSGRTTATGLSPQGKHLV